MCAPEVTYFGPPDYITLLLGKDIDRPSRPSCGSIDGHDNGNAFLPAFPTYYPVCCPFLLLVRS